MERNNKNEMEQIQNSLEEFLRQEVEGYEKTGKGAPRSSVTKSYEFNDDYEERPSVNKQNRSAERNVNTNPRGNANVKQNATPKQNASTKQNTKSNKGNSSRKSNKDKVKKNGKSKSKIRRILLLIAGIALVILVGWFFLVGSMYDMMKYNESPMIAKGPLKEKGVTNILLIGSDSRTEGDEGRSDAMILLSISAKTKSIHMTSLLRDMYVEIPGHKGNRLNAAYSYGGPELLVETIKTNLGIEVSRYVVVNFQAFANLVDAVGGVNLELSNEEVQWVNAYLNEYNLLQGNPIDTNYLDTTLSGMIHLNGPQALAYSRNRYIGTDFGRTERQRKVLSQVMKQMPKGVLTNPFELMNGLFPNLTTNMTKSECFNLSFLGGKLITYDIIQGSIPKEGTYKNSNIRGMDVLEVDFEQNKAYIRTEIYGE